MSEILRDVFISQFPPHLIYVATLPRKMQKSVIVWGACHK